ncbi:MAG TPA: Ig-like domain-containing protein [Candidatus Dormibacteraeota bacterium]|nr:Ig-like domain-containing protein [Candidatus Dormibacteraeota bacterium]
MSSTKQKLRLAGAFAALAALALAVSCTGFFPNPTITSITVGPTGLTLAPGATLQMTASGVPSDNSPNQNITTKCFWSSSNEAAATVGQNTGLVTAATTVANPPQTTTITAAYQALTPATATLSVCPAVTSLTITATPLTFTHGTSVDITFTATATFTGVSGNQDVTNEVTWNITDTNVLSSITSGIGTTSTTSTAGESTQVTATLCSVNSSNSVTITAQ